jgi:hypothetical protein
MTPIMLHGVKAEGLLLGDPRVEQPLLFVHFLAGWNVHWVDLKFAVVKN